MDLGEVIRHEFPAIKSHSDWVFGDAATGTQFHQSVIRSMADFMTKPTAHLFGDHPGAENTIRATETAREHAAAFFNCEQSEVFPFLNVIEIYAF